MLKKRNSLSVKIMAAMLACITTGMFTLSVVNISTSNKLQEKQLQQAVEMAELEKQFEEDLITESLEEKIDMLFSIMSIIAPERILGFDITSLEQYSDALTKDPDIVYAVFLDSSGSPLTDFKESENAKKLIVRDIISDGEKIGSIKIGIDTARINQSVSSVDERINGFKSNILEDIKKDKVSQIWKSGLMGLIVLTITLILVYVFLKKAAINPLMRVTEMMKDIAEGEGDLTSRLEVKTNDEIGDLAKWFNIFIDKIQNIISTVQSGVGKVSSAGSELSSAATGLNNSLKEQMAHSEQTAAAMTEMSQTILDVSKNTTEASDTAKGTANVADEGKSIVKQTVTEINGIAETTEKSAKNIEQLGENSKHIGEIINVIDDIADQTNLLALNAAIEAARAGEHGRGFSVVADEVKKLAEKTGSAIKEISGMINSLQQSTEVTVKNMSGNKTKVESGVCLAEKAEKSLDSIVQESYRCLDMVQSIAAATEQQSTAIEQVSINMEHVASESKTSEERISNINTSSNELSNLANELKDLVMWFKVS